MVDALTGWNAADMARFRCNTCDAILEASLPPFACPDCNAVGKGFSPVTEEAMPEPVARMSDGGQAAAPASARVLWTYQSSEAYGDDELRPLRGCPAIGPGGRIYFAAQHKLIAADPRDQGYEVAWEYPTSGHIIASPCIGPDGNVRIHSSDGYLHVVEESGGQSFAAVEVGEPLGSATPLVDRENNTWINRYRGGLAKVDAVGSVSDRPYFRSRQRLDCTGLIHQGVVYAGAEDNYIYAISTEGKRGINTWDHLVGQGRTGWNVSVALALYGDTIIAASRDDHLYGFSLNGETLWCEPVSGQILGSPVVDEKGGIYVVASEAHRGEQARGTLLRLDGKSQQVRWQFAVNAAIESTPVIGSDGSVYFGDSQGVIRCIDNTGREQWQEDVGCPVRSAGNIVGKERLAFGLDNGSLVVLRCSSEQLMQAGWPKLLGSPENSGVAPVGE